MPNLFPNHFIFCSNLIYISTLLVSYSSIKSYAPLFLNYLNNQHPSIAFTMETEQNQKLPFLDALIGRSNNKFHTSVHRKPIFSGKGLSFFSSCTFGFKLISIKTLLHRAYNICSSYVSLDSEFNF